MKSFSPFRLWNEVLSLIQPASPACPFCGKPVSYGAASSVRNIQPLLPAVFRRQVCASCIAGIPWVNRIVCPVCGRGEYCPDCPRRSRPHFVCNRSAVRYDDRMRGWLALYKYRGNEELEERLADMLMPPLRQMALELGVRTAAPRGRKRAFGQAPDRVLFWDAVAYVPVSRERAAERGFNQAERLAQGLSARTGLPVAHLLHRTRHSGKQSFKTRGERMENTKELFRADPAAIAGLRPYGMQAVPSPVRLLLVDDIYTTGSTMEACSAALQQASPYPLRIYGLTWARS
ncbi:ComF family protein [Paenibacillus thailandensis]|uniref:ComF family protein n=1 Tax=Paenibacillus thailandensis TaxID=393250 RepID=A0ABW5R390_9BACL